MKGVGVLLDKQILKDYVDACELVKETEEDIRRLKAKKGHTVQDSVRGSMQDFPYAPQSFHIEGTEYTYEDDRQLREEERLLLQRKEHAEQIRLQAQQYINFAPVRIQRIFRLRIIKDLTWNAVAEKMGGRCTGESVRKEFQNWLKEK